MIFQENRLPADIIPYLLYWKKQQNLKLSSAANYRNFVTSFLYSEKKSMIFQENRLPADIIPYLLFWIKQQNLKLSSAANYRNFVTSFLYFEKKSMIFQENRLPADDSHEIPSLICYFGKSSKI